MLIQRFEWRDREKETIMQKYKYKNIIKYKTIIIIIIIITIIIIISVNDYGWRSYLCNI